MFFKEHQKKVYKIKSIDTDIDPIRFLNLLIYHSEGRLYQFIDNRNAVAKDEGDISPEGKRIKEVEAATAEINLANCTRLALSNEKLLDAEALEILYEFLEYMEGKESQAGTPQGSVDSMEQQDK